MGKKGSKGHRTPAWRRYARMIVGGVGAAVGLVVGMSPAFRGLETIAKGDLNTGSRAIVYDTTGMDPLAGNVTPDPKRLLGTAVLVGVGIGLMAAFRKLARRI